MSNLVECVPNFSEGRDRTKIDAIVEAIGTGRDVCVLHVDSGDAANRTVVTFVGEADAVERAAFAGIETAVELIDMRTHRGTHPRIGATDVCPIVPIGETPMQDCIDIAQRLGERVSDQLGIPVYLYAEAARVDTRQSLPAIRQGEYEGLEAKLADPVNGPDFGRPEFNARSGATVTGARRFLIAWNVNLDTKNVSIAKRIARKLRSSGERRSDGSRLPGRFRRLQGDGWYIDEFDRVQITFNILDYQTTPIARVYEACREEAAELGVTVTGSELVGLVPRDALMDAGRFYANLRGDDSRDAIEVAVDELGLGEIKPFEPEKRVIEMAYGASSFLGERLGTRL